jgi:hypothetical protein
MKSFHVDVTFEMRTVLYRICLFNDKVSKHGHPICAKWNEGEREQDSRETERQRVCERQSMAKRGDSVSCKTGRWRNVMGEIRIGLQV